jgi:hypothetical protein
LPGSTNRQTAILKKLKVIYIIGAGRSGSTVLDTVLGNHPEVESVGELGNTFRAFSNPDEFCACGRQAGDCLFWSAVQEQWRKLSGFDHNSQFFELQQRFTRLRHFRHLYAAQTNKLGDFNRYIRGERALLEGIALVSNKRIIVDSTKNALRTYALSGMPNVEIFCIHLVRDGRGVVWSLMRPFEKDPKKGVQHDLNAKPAWRTALFWVYANTLSEFAMRAFSKTNRLFVRYEDFVENPDSTLTKISQLTAIDYRDVMKLVSEGKSMSVGHTIAGNRARMSGALKLNPDYEWRKRLSSKDARIFWLIGGHMALRYGYMKNFRA